MTASRSARDELTALRRRIADLEGENGRLRREEERHRFLFAAMNEGFALHEVVLNDAGRPVDLRYIEVNDAFAALFGLTPSDLIGNTIRVRLPTVTPWWIETLISVALTGEPVRFHRQGQVTGRYYEVQAWSPRSGQCPALFHDISERIQAEAALRESEGRFRSVLENSRDVIYRSDLRTGVYGYLSPSIESLTGFTEQELEAMPVTWARERIHPKDRARYLSGIDDLGRRAPAERSETIEYRWRRKDGAYRWVSDSRVLLTDEEDRPVALVGTLRDITTRRAMEQQLFHLNETLEARVVERTRQLRALAAELTVAEEQERRRLARLLHDDLQQILAAVVFHLDRIRGRSATANGELQEPIAMLRQAIQTSRSLTAELSPTIPFDTGLEAALRWLGRRIEEQHGLRVRVNAIESGGAPAIAEDVRVLLYQSARELLFNVAKHARVDEATIQLGRPNADTVELVVMDAGEGFDVPGRAGSPSGTSGFGLFGISERLEYVGGDARIESAPGHGTCVTLTAPRQPLAGHKGGAGGKGSSKRTTEGDEEEEAMGRIRILLVDDHAIVRKGLLLLLQDQPDLVVVGEADDGREAVEMARALHPDVVLMDLAMPHMDGVEATRLIAAEMPEVRVVGLSMYDDHEKEELMRRAGARAYVAKGGPPSALFAAIRGDGRL